MILELPGVAESRLAASVAEALPDSPAPAPWRTRLHAVVWLHRARRDAVAQLPPELRDAPRLPITVGAFVRYDDTPVGPYSEVLGSPILLLGGGLPASTVPFMAVDSLASILGGRANWAFPKTLASFTWSGGRVAGEGEDWSVRAEVRARSIALPFLAVGRDRQVGAEGQLLDMPIRGYGRWRPATVDVRTTGPTLPRWLVSGRHPAVVVEGARVLFKPARRAR